MNSIEYTPSMGKINLTDEMIAALKELPIDEQAKRFGIVFEDDEEEYSYGESTGGRSNSYVIAPERCSYTRQWIVKDGIIVGIVFGDWRNQPAYRFLNEWCNTYFACDDDGTGSTDVSVYCKLVWIND